jgi:protein KRI1
MASAQARKKVLFDDSDDDSDGGVDIKINDEYAKRFEHNKKRAELHRCQFIRCVFYHLSLKLT